MKKMNNLFRITIERINKIMKQYDGRNADRFHRTIDDVTHLIHVAFANTNYPTIRDIIHILDFIDEDLRAHVALRKEKNKCNTGTTKLSNETDSDGN